MPVAITITLTDDGQLNVNGPIDNRMLSYGMLEMARDIIADRARKASENLVQPAAGVILPKL